ncbi:SgcJ/EcaC family oxidoreductase [Aeoliella sp. ICT_H6.2]|uniref:SgcJ/EcaC family oxidoreductase n=1 Tax=Aeoliella straminimaris TaxID=2954799 RepID=A0A9X2JHS9_9BACT|nr:SgcJ/EcaC family oxidoreductase [Aeoliella straminimaris]MCO6043229.1 SgcJ/EcaC family oxidoreductase [Aeoliella straminimaris]
MRYFLLTALAVGVAVSSTARVTAQEPAIEQPQAEAPADPTADVRKAIDSYVKAFNTGDAKALAAHWTEDGELVTADGTTFTGHEQLAKSFTDYFAESSDAKLELVETNVELISPSVASETGIARVVSPDGEPSETEYQVVHVKTPAGWKMDRVSERPQKTAAPSHYEQLRDLEWMIGSWINADDTGVVDVSCRWTTNQNFLVRTFRVEMGEDASFEGTQVIGWDPHSGTIRSWLFDSDGGFGVGRWTTSGGRWTVATLNVLPDGRRGSSTNVYELLDENTVRFSSVGRQVDGELLPSFEPITIVRSESE